MYTDIFKYVKGNERTITRMRYRADFVTIHHLRKIHKDEKNPKKYGSDYAEDMSLKYSIDTKEKYHRSYFGKPIESVLS